jgi:hypothetical protein
MIFYQYATTQSHRVRALLFVTVGLNLFVLFGCAGMSDGTQTRAEGAGAGALAAVLLAKATGQSNSTAAIVGAVGAGIGYAVGDKVAKDKERYSQSEDQLHAVIASAEKATQEARQTNTKLSNDIAVLKQRQLQLAAQGSTQSSKQAALRQQHTRVQQLIGKTTQSIASVDRQLLENHRTLAQQKDNAPAELITVAYRKVSDLDTQRQALVASLEQLKLIDQRRAY